MGQRSLVLVMHAFIQLMVVAAQTNSRDLAALLSLKNSWQNVPTSWVGTDPCGGWAGIYKCNGSRVINILLTNMNLMGQLSGDIGSLSELQTLDLSSNKQMTGRLPQEIGSLKKLVTLTLTGCSFFGTIPDSLGSLEQLVYLSLNSNKFTGNIPNSFGNLSNLYYLDLTDNQLEGSIPVSDETVPGLDMLLQTKHFHFGKNNLSGTIPPKLFSSNMSLIHVFFDNNNLTGSIPSTLGLVQTLEAVRFDRNSLSGPLPKNLNDLTNVTDLYLSNNNVTGPIPNLTGMNSLSYVDVSNNSFDVSDVPAWISSLQTLTILMMEHTQLQGPIPFDLFRLPHIQTVLLSHNKLNGTLNISTTYAKRIDLQNNTITDFQTTGGYNATILLEGNPFCKKAENIAGSYCSSSSSNSTYSIPPPTICSHVSCSVDQVPNPNCNCVYPYKATLIFRAISNLDLGNTSYYVALEKSLMQTFDSYELPVDSVSLGNPFMDSFGYFGLSLEVFPSGGDRFNQTEMLSLGFVLTNLTYNPPKLFGPFYFIATTYAESNKPLHNGIIIGATIGGSVLLLLSVLAGLYAFHQKKKADRAFQNNPFAHWNANMKNGGFPQLQAARCFSFEELKKSTNNFSEANVVGSGGHGKVFRGTLSTGQLIAIKRARADSLQGGHEFKTEIELLSRVHHKNLVSLVGFCFEQREQILVYEYIQNGSLMDSLSGKSEFRLDWMMRLKVALGTARGLAYLHEHANPPIIHRDIKSSNILLDVSLNAKVADFGLSKPKVDSERAYVTTQVKGTPGYLDPEYYMTQQLTKKSDVYSFGVVMLELITARRPIERGKYIVRVIKNAIDEAKDLYNLHEILDPAIDLGTKLKGLEKFVKLSMRCVEESRAKRPTMSEVVKEIENIMQLAGMTPNIAKSTSTSTSYEEASKGGCHRGYIDDAFDSPSVLQMIKLK
ncbi:leucine-rich repeat receptor protein kinase HPCA1-like [Carya illinoinensis]|nr:leucine-rich repeat receptor protein kinase HPCA1-like [Carya illinoinensis]